MRAEGSSRGHVRVRARQRSRMQKPRLPWGPHPSSLMLVHPLPQTAWERGYTSGSGASGQSSVHRPAAPIPNPSPANSAGEGSQFRARPLLPMLGLATLAGLGAPRLLRRTRRLPSPPGALSRKRGASGRGGELPHVLSAPHGPTRATASQSAKADFVWSLQRIHSPRRRGSGPSRPGATPLQEPRLWFSCRCRAWAARHPRRDPTALHRICCGPVRCARASG